MLGLGYILGELTCDASNTDDGLVGSLMRSVFWSEGLGLSMRTPDENQTHL